MRKNILLLVVTVLFVLTFSQQAFAQSDKTEKAILDLENKIVNALKNKQFDAAPQFFIKEYMGIYSYGIVSRDNEMKDIREVDLKEWAMSDIKFIHVSKDVVILVYKTKIQGSFKGQDISGNYFVSSTWVKRGGKWLTAAHTEAKADEGV
jgi:hypothetical protein